MGTVRDYGVTVVKDGVDGQGLWCHDGGRSDTMGHDDLKMVTGR